MGEEKLAGEALCRALMHEVYNTIYSGARRQINYLRRGAIGSSNELVTRPILKLISARLTDEQLCALEGALCQVQEELIDWLFCIIEGSAQPEGFPDEIRLVNMDTGEAICPDELTWAFARAGREWQARMQDRGMTGSDKI